MKNKRKIAGMLTLGASVAGIGASAAMSTSADLTNTLKNKGLKNSELEEQRDGYEAAESIAEKIREILKREESRNKIEVKCGATEVLTKLIFNEGNFSSDEVINAKKKIDSVEKKITSIRNEIAYNEKLCTTDYGFNVLLVRNSFNEVIKLKGMLDEEQKSLKMEKNELNKAKLKELKNDLVEAGVRFDAGGENSKNSDKLNLAGELKNLASKIDNQGKVEALIEVAAKCGVNPKNIIDTVLEEVAIKVPKKELIFESLEHIIDDENSVTIELESEFGEKQRVASFKDTKYYNELFSPIKAKSENCVDIGSESFDTTNSSQETVDVKKIENEREDSKKYENRVEILNELGYHYSSLLNNWFLRTSLAVGISLGAVLFFFPSAPMFVLATVGYGLFGILAERFVYALLQFIEPPKEVTRWRALCNALTPNKYTVKNLFIDFAAYTINGFVQLGIGKLIGGWVSQSVKQMAGNGFFGDIIRGWKETTIKDAINVGEMAVKKAITVCPGVATGFAAKKAIGYVKSLNEVDIPQPDEYLPGMYEFGF